MKRPQIVFAGPSRHRRPRPQIHGRGPFVVDANDRPPRKRIVVGRRFSPVDALPPRPSRVVEARAQRRGSVRVVRSSRRQPGDLDRNQPAPPVDHEMRADLVAHHRCGGEAFDDQKRHRIARAGRRPGRIVNGAARRNRGIAIRRGAAAPAVVVGERVNGEHAAVQVGQPPDVRVGRQPRPPHKHHRSIRPAPARKHGDEQRRPVTQRRRPRVERRSAERRAGGVEVTKPRAEIARPG